MAAGQLHVGQAVADGVSGVLRNFLPILGALVLGYLVYTLSALTCLGWFIVVPLLLYGSLRMLLQLPDGNTQLATLWSGTQRFGQTFLSMWALIVLFILIVLSLPPFLVGMVLSVALDPLQAAVAGVLVGALYSLVAVRFFFAPFLVVEGRANPMEALGQSWGLTGPFWGKLLLLQVLNLFLGAPVEVMRIGLQQLTQTFLEDFLKGAEPAQLLEQLYPMLGLSLASMVALLISLTLSWSFFAAAYRQVVGRPR